MAVLQIIDADGEWLHNRCSYSFCDPETRVNFQPGGHFYKVVVGEGSWLAGQLAANVFERVSDPVAEPPPSDSSAGRQPGPEPATKGGRKK